MCKDPVGHGGGRGEDLGHLYSPSASDPQRAAGGVRTKGNSFSRGSRGARVRGFLQDNQGNRSRRGRTQEATMGKGSERVSVSSCECQVHRPQGEISAVGSCFLSELSGEGLRKETRLQ